MPKPVDCLVPCIYCVHGRNGDKSCAPYVWKLDAGGCFIGQVLPGYERKHAAYIRRLKRSFVKGGAV